MPSNQNYCSNDHYQLLFTITSMNNSQRVACGNLNEVDRSRDRNFRDIIRQMCNPGARMRQNIELLFYFIFPFCSYMLGFGCSCVHNQLLILSIMSARVKMAYVILGLKMIGLIWIQASKNFRRGMGLGTGSLDFFLFFLFQFMKYRLIIRATTAAELTR